MRTSAPITKQIAFLLNRDKLTTPQGKVWKASNVASFLYRTKRKRKAAKAIQAPFPKKAYPVATTLIQDIMRSNLDISSKKELVQQHAWSSALKEIKF